MEKPRNLCDACKTCDLRYENSFWDCFCMTDCMDLLKVLENIEQEREQKDENDLCR